MRAATSQRWPIYIEDRAGYRIYLTEERWLHALDHPGMHPGLLEEVLETIRSARGQQDAYGPAKRRYSKSSDGLPEHYTHMVVVVKFGVTRGQPVEENNFVLTAYLIEKWANR
jgi:hypothetical protein